MNGLATEEMVACPGCGDLTFERGKCFSCSSRHNGLRYFTPSGEFRPVSVSKDLWTKLCGAYDGCEFPIPKNAFGLTLEDAVDVLYGELGHHVTSVAESPSIAERLRDTDFIVIVAGLLERIANEADRLGVVEL